MFALRCCPRRLYSQQRPLLFSQLADPYFGVTRVCAPSFLPFTDSGVLAAVRRGGSPWSFTQHVFPSTVKAAASASRFVGALPSRYRFCFGLRQNCRLLHRLLRPRQR